MYFFDQRIGDSWKFYHVRVHILVDGVWSCNFQELKYSWVLQILTVFLWVFFGFGTRLDWASLVLSSILRVLTALSDDLTSVAKSKKHVGRPSVQQCFKLENCVGNLQNLGFKLLREVDELVQCHDIFPGVKKTFDQKYTFLYGKSYLFHPQLCESFVHGVYICHISEQTFLVLLSTWVVIISSTQSFTVSCLIQGTTGLYYFSHSLPW